MVRQKVFPRQNEDTFKVFLRPGSSEICETNVAAEENEGGVEGEGEENERWEGGGEGGGGGWEGGCEG